MVGVAGVEGVRRRLPPWMQPIASAPGSDRDNRDEIQEVEDELVSSKQSKKAALPVENCETKRRKRGVSQQDAPSDNGAASAAKMSICLQEKQVREPSHRRKRKATSGRPRRGRDSKNPSPFDDDEELTPEDLVSIAEEYVEADKNAGLLELSTMECDFASQLSTAVSPKAESGSCLITIDGNQKSSADETFDSTRSPKMANILSMPTEQEILLRTCSICF
ncbi:uncharacterized protein LOC120210584 [Hibiscus syriacus]|uniref:uncharacterized protein LOC120210584 n=1 Tax=Hibiscus syriacus TaxID=106335 RepID=UPI00192173F2|nr:uncharacterized protein LOC120210584 [Hibiscus syriacus]